MKKNETSWGQYLFLIFGLLVLVNYSYSNILFHPNHIYFSLSGDGGKNMFTYLYHSCNGHGTHFTGMNYPFGEHILFVDGLPLLSVPLSYFHPSINTALVILCYSVVISFLLGGVFTFKLLRLFQIPYWWAFITALLIIQNSPQVYRIVYGHIGLGYVFLLPMLLYYLIQYHFTSQKKYIVFNFIIILIASFIHLYYLGISLMIIGCYLMLFLFNNSKNKARKLMPLLLLIISCVSIVKGFLYFTDKVNDRPITPYGILEGCSTFSDIFSSEISPIWIGIKNLWGISLYGRSEGYIYIGLVGIFTLFIATLTFIYRKIEKINQPILKTNFPNLFLVIAILILLFGMGVPFVWGLEDWADYIPFIKQFRTHGRFSWCTYYLIKIYAVLIFYQFIQRLRQKNQRKSAVIILSLAFVVEVIETNGIIINCHNESQKWEYYYDYNLDKDQVTINHKFNKYGLKKTDFQSVLMLPYFHVGSEKIWLGDEYPGLNWKINTQFSITELSQIPGMASSMSRSGWQNTFDLVRMVGGKYANKNIFSQLPNRKPILMFKSGYNVINPDVQYLVDCAQYIDSIDYNKYYILYPDSVLKRDELNKNWIKNEMKNKGVGDYNLTNNHFYWTNHFEKNSKVNSLFGVGSLKPDFTKDILLDSVLVSNAFEDSLYEFSGWGLLLKKDFRGVEFKIEIYNHKNEKIYENTAPSKTGTDNIGMWIRSYHYFTMPKDSKYILIKSMNNSGHVYCESIDECMIREANTTIVSKNEKGQIMANNHLIN